MLDRGFKKTREIDGIGDEAFLMRVLVEAQHLLEGRPNSTVTFGRKRTDLKCPPLS